MKRWAVLDDYPTLPRAPIVEGLIDLRVRLPEGFDVRSLAAFDAEIAERYPHLEQQFVHEGKLRFTAEL